MVKKNGYEYSIDGLLVNITRDGRPFLSVPAAASVNGNVSELALSRADENAAVFTSDSGEMSFTFFDDCVVVSYELRFGHADLRNKNFQIGERGYRTCGF